MISKTLSATLGFAVREAKKRRHEYVCLEHVLFAILHDSTGIDIVESCGGDVEALKKNLEEYFNTRLEIMPEVRDYVLQQTVGFQRVIQRAVSHARSAEKNEINVGDVLAAMFQEQDSHAVYYLTREGVTRLAVLQHISHEIGSVDDNRERPEQAPEQQPGGDEAQKKVNPLKAFTIDPLIGRDAEVERAIHVLCRRRKNNPVFVGDPGVGKTAIAEGIAQRISDGTAPEILKDARIFALDMGAVIAGTKFRGDFEQRLKKLIMALQKVPNGILFIDEIHTIVGAGATSSGSLDASNILKPALTSGSIRCIGSTTYEEFKSHFEKDRALARRFEKIEIAEPSIPEAVEILKGLKGCYEEHHHVVYSDEALDAAVNLSAKYINDRFLPDKAIDVIDEVGAYIMLSSKKKKNVDVEDVEKIIAKMAKVPVRSVAGSDRLKLSGLETRLKKVVFGQDAAIQALCTAIKRSRAGLGPAEKPVGSFLFTGPTGVGKTEVAKQLAAQLSIHFIRFDMSEYMEKHAVARLIGAPPGYVGFEQGGLLTDEVRKHPHSVLLLDEIEKAHMDIFNILLQVMDHATLTDNNGKKADFRNVIIIMTSNVGSREMASRSIGFGDASRDMKEKGKGAVKNLFSPEFLNRLDETINFNRLTPEIMNMVVEKFMDELRTQLAEKNVHLRILAKAREWLARKGYDEAYGARPLGRLIQTEIKDVLSDQLLFGELENGGKVTIGMKDDRLTFSYAK
jgi:ATP-dependent Clp protease ATP-binding subunit ClpA